MSRPRLDLHEKIRDILLHAEPLSPDVDVPIDHYQNASNDLLGLWTYLDRKIRTTGHYPAVLNRHMDQLNMMILVHQIESLERFFKDLAALCVDRLAPCVPDDRLNAFSASGGVLAAHLAVGSLGKALFESTLWLDCKEIRARFANLLGPMDGGANWAMDAHYEVFGPYPISRRRASAAHPRSPAGTGTFESLDLLWQIRHTIIHNLGVITQSDALKLRRAARRPVAVL
jgi:hypothetical protein